MYTKADLLAAIARETRIIKHLLKQVPASAWDHRPTPGQRSTLELARYLTQTMTSATTFALTGNWDHYEQMQAAADALTPAQLSRALDRQVKAVTALLDPISDAALRRRQVTTWSGRTTTLGDGLVEMVLQVVTAYRMQLFLYAKAAGAEGLGTADCWMGRKRRRGD